MKKIILFDGECSFCHQGVQFILKRDKRGVFQFSSLHSGPGRKLLHNYGIPLSIDSLVFIDNDQYFSGSTAVLKICRHLSGAWKFFYIFIFFPKSWRDFFYQAVARNRYKWFGKANKCFLPPPDAKDRFLDLS